MTDSITDMFNRIKNAQAVSHSIVSIPFSNLKYEIAQILEREGFISKIEKKGKRLKKIIEITLKYENKIPAISGFKRVSKPGQRIYLKAKKIKKIRGGSGIAIISTPKGIMIDKEAKRQKLGGEVICEIYR